MRAAFLALLVAFSGCTIPYPQEAQPSNRALEAIDFSVLNIALDPATGMSAVKTFVFRGAGASMQPALAPGKEYLCMEQKDYLAGDIVVYKASLQLAREPTAEQMEQGYVLTAHRVISIQDGYYKIRGDSNRAVDTATKDKIICRILA